MKVVSLLGLLGIALLLSACGEKKSILDEGVGAGMLGERHVVGSTEARRAARTTTMQWERELRRGAEQRPRTRFRNLPPNELRRRLDLVARKLDFEVVSIEFLHPRQLAPKIVVRTSDYLRLTRATAGLLRRLDPKQRTTDRTGWRYEGFYVRAEDEHGTPFMIVYNFWRGGGGGGEWARSERLYPFQHG